MHFKRKLITTLKALPTILTFRRYYLCDQCRKLHRFTGHEFSPYGGRWERYVFVNETCSEKVVRKAAALLFNEAISNLFREASNDE